MVAGEVALAGVAGVARGRRRGLNWWRDGRFHGRGGGGCTGGGGGGWTGGATGGFTGGGWTGGGGGGLAPPPIETSAQFQNCSPPVAEQVPRTEDHHEQSGVLGKANWV